MVEEASIDYSKYFQQINVSKTLAPISTNIDEMLTRLDEFESLLTIVQNDSSKTMNENFPQLETFCDEYGKLTKRIDDLEKFVNIVNANLVVIEQDMERAEEELAPADYSLKGIFKPFFNRSRSDGSIASGPKVYEQPNIFNTSDFFGEPKESTTDVSEKSSK